MKRYFLIYIALLAALCARAAEPRFTYDEIAKGRFRPRTLAGLRPMADGERYTLQQGTRIAAFRYEDGRQTDVLFDGAALDPQIKFSDYLLSPDGNMILLATNARRIYRHSFSADWQVWDRRTGQLRRLSEAGSEQQPAFSPDGRRVGFVHENNLMVADLASGAVRAITTDGERNRIINGLPDWVYEEEYAFSRAFCFSPDGNRIAWLRFDESGVREYTLLRYQGNLYPETYTYKYPKAGEDNSLVEAFVCDLRTGAVTRPEVDCRQKYIPRLGFTPEGELWLMCVDRRQQQLEVVVCGPQKPYVAYEEHSGRYVERPDDHTVTFLPGGRMVVVSENSGRRHIYLYEKQGVKYALKNAVTSGDWDVAELVGIADGKAWYLSGEDSPLRRSLWCTGLDGRGKRRLTQGEGTVRVAPGEGMRYYINYFTNASTPLIVSVHRGDGRRVRTIEENAALAQYIDSLRMPRREFFTLPAADGTPLNAWVLRPEGFDPARRYPVLVTQYSGPGSQQVTDAWRVDWEDVMVQHGYVVVCVDPRGTGMRGRDFRQCTYGRLGELETEDQLAAARWIASQAWADPARIGIYGWSYGGFMALNCAVHGEAGLFKLAIAVAPVTSWRFYDTIYTEIYNGLPQDNPGGYDRPSPLTHAASLNCRLLMIHGLSDDNVHPQNSFEMASALMRAGKKFDLEVYPDCNHSMLPGGRDHIRQRMVDYTLANL